MKGSEAETLLEVNDLNVVFGLAPNWLSGEALEVRAVNGVSFRVKTGSTFGIVGESGSGKTTTAMAVMRLVPVTGGKIWFRGQEISELRGNPLREVRRHMQLIFQDPYSSLDPRRRAGALIREPLDRLRIGTASERNERVEELLQLVGLRPEQALLFPHQFSGGQRQRISIARALASRPQLIVCDEPVSALDVAIQAQVLNLLRRLQKELGLTYLFISHDLGVVQHMCDEVAVMYLGRVVEQASRRELFEAPQHPYTRALLSAVPSIENVDQRTTRRLKLVGDPPSPLSPPSGCAFHTRCPFVENRCRTEIPQLLPRHSEHHVACHYAGNLKPF